jgi:hypothetical protein
VLSLQLLQHGWWWEGLHILLHELRVRNLRVVLLLT